MRCIKCSRPLKNTPINGMGRVCASRAGPPPPSADRDLFGFDIDGAVKAANYRINIAIESAAVEAHAAIRAAFLKARVRHGVWA